MTDRDKVVRELHDRHWGECPTEYKNCPNIAIIEECYDAGRAAERAAVVAWLRAQATEWAKGPDTKNGAYEHAVTEAADAIERGEHLK